jgi:putative transposase
VPTGLKRYYGERHLHFITTSCYRRQRHFDSPRRRDCFLRVLEEVRAKFRFMVVGYVVMPEHVHLLISEPEIGDPSQVMQVLKQRVAKRLRPRRRARTQIDLFPASPHHFWQKRFYDFNVFTARKRIEKLKYMHRNPVKRGLVPSPELWAWSSFRSYYYDERGLVTIDKV